ncbi:hypothetical protein [Rhodococcus sp. 5G237]
MTRSRASAKAAGARFERLIADALAQHVDDRIDRRVKTGAADKGDIAGLRLSDGSKVVAELKDYGGTLKVGPWLNEAATERINDDALASIVVAKRRGTQNPLDQIVLCTLADFIAIITHHRPEESQ